MNSATIGYQLPTFTGLVSHAWSKVSLVRDTEASQFEGIDLELEAQVRSGDYFVDLATRLDLLARAIDDYHTRASVETIVSDLIYLQDNYAITKSKPSQ